MNTYKSIVWLGLLFLSVNFASAQEFKGPEGLMYDAPTMKRLEYIVDSLNTGFKSCDLDRDYYSLPWATAHVIYLETNQVKKALKDINANISLAEFKECYPNAEVSKNRIITRHTYANYKDEEVVQFNELSMGQSSVDHELSFTNDIEKYTGDVEGNWYADAWDKYLTVFYFTSNFQRTKLPTQYSRMVQYSECLIDTNGTVFYEKAQYTGGFRGTALNEKVEALMEYIEDKFRLAPEYDSENYPQYRSEYEEWDSLRTECIENELSQTRKFKRLLEEAVLLAQDSGGSNSEFEDLVANYYSKSMALDLKRGRKVMGMCSMDRSPRIHAMNIAVLSAETANWEVFLRSHLNIMNDRFDRVASSNYGEQTFQTYIRELEALNIDVPDLIFGISLRVDNVGEHHYFGNINRIGRALSESMNRMVVEKRMREMIQNEELDMFNRVFIYYMYRNYIGHLEEDQQEEQIEKLQAAVKSMPEGLRSDIEW